MCNNIINTQCPEKGTTIFLPVTSSKLLQRQTGKKVTPLFLDAVYNVSVNGNDYNFNMLDIHRESKKNNPL